MVATQLDLSIYFLKGSKLTEVKPFSHGLISPQHTKYIWENKKR